MNLIKGSQIAVDSWASLRQYSYTRMSIRSPLELSAPKAAIFPLSYANPVKIEESFKAIDAKQLKREIDKIFPYPIHLLQTEARTRLAALTYPQAAQTLTADSLTLVKQYISDGKPCLHIVLSDGYCPDALTLYGVSLLRMILKRNLPSETRILIWIVENSSAKVLLNQELINKESKVWSISGALPKLHTKPSLILQSFKKTQDGFFEEEKIIRGIRGHFIYSAAYQWHEAHPII